MSLKRLFVKKIANQILIPCLLLGANAYAADDVSIDATRPHLAKLKSGEKTRFSDFIFPYLIVESGVVRDKTPVEVAEQVKNFLKKTSLDIRGHFSKGGVAPNKIDRETLPLPKPAITGKQLSGLDGCNNEFCVMKLQTKSEKPLVTNSTTKLATFHQIVVDRLKNFLVNNELKGFEDRASNEPSVKQMVDVLDFLKSDYPKCGHFFPQYFWTKKKSPCVPVDSLIREEMVVFEKTILQPILRLSEVFQFEEHVKDQTKFLFVEIHVYSNHYFDSSLRTYEVFPSAVDPKKTILAVTDIMEIDELAKSGLVRFLYQGKMVGATAEAQESDISQMK